VISYIESGNGRLVNTNLGERLCTMYDMNVIDDDGYFLFHCPAYDIERALSYDLSSNLRY
jgi:hypothetical protein